MTYGFEPNYATWGGNNLQYGIVYENGAVRFVPRNVEVSVTESPVTADHTAETHEPMSSDEYVALGELAGRDLVSVGSL